MAKEICISSTPHETRLAILEDDQLAEIYYERENEYTLAGSIYNGRVTRVLPGMQSAFVDLGLERDAFLYVTDFLELEDQEESDELEKAAVSGGSQAPREVRPGSRQSQERAEPEQRGGRRDPERSGREPQRERRPAAEPVIEVEHVQAPESAGSPVAGQDETGDAGGKRWRGRRRRRGGRGPADHVADPVETESSAEIFLEPAAEHTVAPPQEAPTPRERSSRSSREAAAPPAHSPRQEREPAAFVLPGESLSKYGREITASAAPPRAEASARPAPSFKPSTMVDSPLTWDGSGLLPGESLARHRGDSAKPSRQVDEEPRDIVLESDYVTPVESSLQTEKIVEEDLVFEEQSEEDRSASHHVDPLPPSEFRLFGMGGKKKKSDEAQGSDSPAPVRTPAGESSGAARSASAFSPGAGLVEEETIEGEEFDAPRHHHHKADEHDLDDYEEEEKVQKQIRSGELGEMLQEAHLDHRIQLNFNDKNGEGDEEFDIEEEGDEQPAAEPGAAAGQPRRERGGRNRRSARGTPERGNGRRPSRRSAQTSDLPIISDLLKPGQEILVQIAKEPIAKKGARITSHIALPGRFLVFMPTVSHVGVSRKIASDEERQRLKRILTSERGDASGGFIVRTAAEGASEEELRADLRFLIHLWDEIKDRSEKSKSPALIYHDLSLIERILRDQVSADFSSIWVDSQEDYERIVRFLNRFSPTLVRRVKLYTKETPLFEHFGIQDEISKALRSKVWLKSGGSIVINQTEALVAIDINTGKYVGKTARLEDTIVKTNLDAIPEIVRQIRLRDLGGIIIIDFIDMDERKNRFRVMAALEEALKNDRAPTKVLQFNDFGLVAITRKRVKQSLERTLSVPCPTCQATGMVKSPATVCNEIYTELRKMRKHFENADVLLRVNPETVKVLKANDAHWLTEFEDLVGKNILVKSDATLHPEQFDIQG